MAGPAFRRVCLVVLVVVLSGCVVWVSVAGAVVLPDGRGYELVSPVAKNGLSPYAAVPSTTGGAVDFQARGAFAGATSGALNLYQATRTAGGWQTAPLTPAPSTPLGALEEQAPVWLSADLSEAIFTTPESYAPGDQDGGALSLYAEAVGGGLSWLSQGSQGGTESSETTFDGASPDGNHVVFSSHASLIPPATGLGSDAAPEAEYLYERNAPEAQTHLLNVNNAGQIIGSLETTLPKGYTPGPTANFIAVALIEGEGFFPGQFITVGEGESELTTQITQVFKISSTTESLGVGNNAGLPIAYPVGTRVAHLSEGAILGDGGDLASGVAPASEYLPADAGSGSTTHAVSSDGSKVFFESPNPAVGEPVGLYVRIGNATTVKIAGASADGTRLSGLLESEAVIFGSARFEGAAADGSLVFFTSGEGLAGATSGGEVYEFNTTGHEIGGVSPLSVGAVSAGLGGDRTPASTLTATAAGRKPGVTIRVASTAGFHAGEEIMFAPFETEGEFGMSSGVTSRVASVDSATELTLSEGLIGVGFGVPAGTEVHGVHPASVVAVADDGSRVYFVSDGVLAENTNAQGASAVPVQPNLYVFDTATQETAFIGTLASSDVRDAGGNPSGLVGEPDISRPAVPSPDGGVLVFASAADLTGQNPWQQYTEIYRYSVAGNSLVCVSCTAPGVKPAGNASFGETAGGTYDPPGLTSPMSADGARVFFQTPDSLVAEDTNGSAPVSPKFGTPTSTDVYEWEEGHVSLISSGSASTPAVLMGATPSGNDALFTTTAQLVPSETDGGYENVFDARVDGGFPAAAKAGPSCSGSGCTAAFGLAPTLQAPASASLRGPGNTPAKTTPKPKPKHMACGKRHVRRHVKGRTVCARRAKNTQKAGSTHAH